MLPGLMSISHQGSTLSYFNQNRQVEGTSNGIPASHGEVAPGGMRVTCRIVRLSSSTLDLILEPLPPRLQVVADKSAN